MSSLLTVTVVFGSFACSVLFWLQMLEEGFGLLSAVVNCFHPRLKNTLREPSGKLLQVKLDRLIMQRFDFTPILYPFQNRICCFDVRFCCCRETMDVYRGERDKVIKSTSVSCLLFAEAACGEIGAFVLTHGIFPLMQTLQYHCHIHNNTLSEVRIQELIVLHCADFNKVRLL